MKLSTWRKLDKALFWFTLVINLLCVVCAALTRNVDAVLGWSCATMWLCLCRRNENRLEEERETTLPICVWVEEQADE